METGSLEEELANLALGAVQNPTVGFDKLMTFFEDKRPSSQVIANAIGRSGRWLGTVGPAIREVLSAQLQLALTIEHVKARADAGVGAICTGYNLSTYFSTNR